jgi:hypothetical protein
MKKVLIVISVLIGVAAIVLAFPLYLYTKLVVMEQFVAWGMSEDASYKATTFGCWGAVALVMIIYLIVLLNQRKR